MKKFAKIIAAVALIGAPHYASAATVILPIGTLFPGVLTGTLPVVGEVVGVVEPVVTSLNLPIGGLVPTLLDSALPAVGALVGALEPILGSLDLPLGGLVPTLLQSTLPALNGL